MKVYAVVESMTLIGCINNEFESDNLGANVKLCRSRADAEKTVKALIEEYVQCEYDGNETITDKEIENEVNDVFIENERPSKNEWFWDATNRACLWRIFEIDFTCSSYFYAEGVIDGFKYAIEGIKKSFADNAERLGITTKEVK